MDERTPAAPGRTGGVVPPLVSPGPPLTSAQRERWSRHLLLPAIGEVGQRRLRNARVCVVGAGGLGAPVLQYLAAAGVGRIGVVDVDDVELSNLQRQVVHGVADVGRAKVASAADAVRRIDPDVELVEHHVRLDEGTVDLLAGYDVVVDGTDNFPTRYLVNDACVRLGLPEVWGSVFRFDAQVSVFWGRPPGGVAPVQLRDLFPEPPAAGAVPSCAEGGVLGAMCGQVGTLMATEVVKLVTGAGRPLLGRVLVLDALEARWAEIPLVGGGARSDSGEGTGSRAAVASGSADQATAGEVPVRTVTPRELAALLAARTDAPAGRDRMVLVDVREPAELDVVAVPGAVNVPLARVLDGSGLSGLAPEAPTVVLCRSGVRSERAARALVAAGWSDVAHVERGVLGWVDDVDPSLARY
ncbi:ThiF family adenylyltransferase [Cellulomonas carbonis]|uniref:Molybdopterin biosynthesis-like protein MoeZ n=1 Tax=Cellulomonas carbonis T26 TaxID=947969 RepID=A0A0A0BLQ7_9CELL|nr:ThiF family adenylyltransferase [Cellulomonas carbonis]KGM08622.1 molybdopterin biosynthesis-like protein MoeZ [Cellulomonas carbonis T26]GGB92572.1 adenylyltransferase/sulfurtransferase MoeZ [Cellulomonas carbonis]